MNNKTKTLRKIANASSALFLFALLAVGQNASAALVPGGAVGPVVPAGLGKGFPAWYMDQNGLALELTEAADGFGISDPVDPANNFSRELGFNAEGFYWSADALPANPNGPVGIIVLALEAAFAGENAVDGEQSVFGRVRIRFDVGEPGTYTVRHPFGTNTYVVDTVLPGAPEINDSSDIGCFATLGVLSCNPNNPAGNPNNFGLALQSGIGPFITWDTFNLNPALTDPALINAANPTKRYVGNPNVPHAVTGSPVGQNFFRIEGPNVGGPGINFIQENNFTVTGRIAVIDVTPPTVVSVTPTSAGLGTVNQVLSANITDDLGVRNVSVDLGALGNSFTATLNGAQEVPASASTATGSGTFTIDTTANTLTFNITTTGVASETAAHIHGPAAAGANALPIFDLPLGASKIGTWTYSENLEADILAGRTYVNVHTTLRPDGDIRGQILPTANVQSLELISGTITSGNWGVVIPSLNRLGAFTLPITVSDGSNVTNFNHTLTVNTLASVSVAPATATIVGAGTQQLTASPLDNNGSPFVGATITWSSDNTAAATVDTTGLVTGVLSQTPASAIITTSAVSGATTVTGTSSISVSPGLPVLTTVNITPNPASIVVNPLAPAGTTLQLSATVLDQFNVPFVGATVTWASNNTAVATVDASGLVTSVTPGTATITATSGLISGTTSLSVLAIPQVLTSISVTPATASIITGATQQFTASALDQFGSPMIPQPTLTWTSSNSAVAAVDAIGLAAGLTPGGITITATSDAVSGTAALTVTLSPPVLTVISVTPATSSVAVGATQQLTAAALDQRNDPFALLTPVIWTSDNPTVATVDANGMVAGVAPGTATTTAANGAISGQATISVPFSLLATDLPALISGGGGGIFTLPALTPATSTPSVTLALPLNLNVILTGNGTTTVAIPSGTVITKTDGTNLDVTALSANTVASGALTNLGDVTINGSVQWGIPNVGLEFSQPITVNIFVGTALNGQTLNIQRSITGGSGWTSDGIVAPATSLVVNGMITFQATKASFYAATTPNPAPAPAPAPVSSGGGGGGGAPAANGGIIAQVQNVSATSNISQKIDSNKDNKIDILDFNNLMVNWGSTQSNNSADFNGDAKVDILDFNLLMVYWTK